MNNIEKRDKYAYLMKKLDEATSNEYYYEAIFIEYAILEDRTESLLRHAGIENLDSHTKRPYTLNNKLKIINNNDIFKSDEYVKKHLTEDLIASVYDWKDERNGLIHDLVNSTYQNDEIKKLALDGECLVKRFNTKSQLVNKYLEK